jgi:hypothetical protein
MPLKVWDDLFHDTISDCVLFAVIDDTRVNHEIHLELEVSSVQFRMENLDGAHAVELVNSNIESIMVVIQHKFDTGEEGSIRRAVQFSGR